MREREFGGVDESLQELGGPAVRVRDGYSQLVDVADPPVILRRPALRIGAMSLSRCPWHGSDGFGRRRIFLCHHELVELRPCHSSPNGIPA